MNDKEILALEDKRLAAMAAGDFAALETRVHDELLYTHSCGVTDTKASWLESMKSVRTPQGWKFAAWQSCPQP